MLAGEIGKPHGISGEVYVRRISDDPERFNPGSRLMREDGRVLVVEGVRAHRRRLLVKFEGVDSRADADALRGPLYVSPESVRALGKDEYWEHALVGCSVALLNGQTVGRVTGLVPGGPQDLLTISTSRGERLVPAVKDIVVDVDVERRFVVIDPPEGLLD